MVPKNNGYKIVQILLLNKEIKTFEEIFEVITRTRLAKDMNMHYNRLGTKIRNPEKFAVKDVQRMSKLFSVNDEILYSFIGRLANRGMAKLSQPAKDD